MYLRLGLFLSLLLLIGVGCGRHVQPNAKPPPEFVECAQKFRARAGLNRRAEGEKIQTLLPCCPKTWEKDIGTGTLMTFDYEHPSYKLTKPELLRALGQPDSSYNDIVWYVISHETDDMLYQLSIEFHEGYVVGSSITGVPKNDR